MMRFNKNAFTLTELLIALGVIGVLTAILLPVIMNLLPDQNALMAKRAYYATQTVVSDLINNEACYPDTSDALSEARVGFDDGFPRTNCAAWSPVAADKDETTGKIKEKDANQKFMTLFMNSLDVKTLYDGGFKNNQMNFITKDGLYWSMQAQGDSSSSVNANSFASKKKSSEAYISVYIDVNGKEKPNRVNIPTDSRKTLPLYDYSVTNENGKSS